MCCSWTMKSASSGCADADASACPPLVSETAPLRMRLLIQRARERERRSAAAGCRLPHPGSVPSRSDSWRPSVLRLWRHWTEPRSVTTRSPGTSKPCAFEPFAETPTHTFIYFVHAHTHNCSCLLFVIVTKFKFYFL